MMTNHQLMLFKSTNKKNGGGYIEKGMGDDCGSKKINDSKNIG